MGSYEWSQSEAEVVLKVPLEDSVGKDSLKVKIQTNRVTIVVAGKSVFASELSAKVDEDDSFWSLDGSGGSRCLVVTLTKKKAVQWKALTKDEEERLPEPSVLDEKFDVQNLEHDDDDPERVEEQEENERKLEARYKKLLVEKGLDDESTLETFFALFDNCIQLYRLKKLDDYLKDVVPACRKRTDKYKLKAIQALSFVRWKQSKFREALPLFHEMEEMLGKGAALCENIAHTYNSLGDYDKAEDYFRQALKFIEQEHGANKGNRGGVLLGLGIVRDRLGKHREALPVCTKAYEFYKERANGAPASLQAKAGISCAKLHVKLGDLPKAEAYIREAVQMYEVTCGETSPLTASAYHELGKCLWAQRKRDDAQKALKRAYEIESMKDAWDLVALLEIHNLLMDTHLKETDHIERSKFENYMPIVEYVTNRVRRELPQDGNAAVYYKAAAELKAWGGRYTEARALFEQAVPLFQMEKSTDCSGLIHSCNEMLAFCGRNLEGKQNSPMDFELPTKHSEGAGVQAASDPKWNGVVIEELDDDGDSDGGEGSKAAPGATPAEVPGQVAPSPAEGYTYRAMEPDDCAEAAKLCTACACEPLFHDNAAFMRHIAGAGAGLCWAAIPHSGNGVEALAICGSDGVFGHLLQLLVPGTVATVVRQELAERCAGACRAKGLRALRSAVSIGSVEAATFEQLGWRASHQVYETHFDGVAQEGGSCNAGPSSSSAGSKVPSKLSRDGKDTGKYYNAWDTLDVERVLVEEEGGDAAIVPDKTPNKEDFGENRLLDVSSRISNYSWDQTNNTISIYISFDGAKALPEESIETYFRPRGVLLIISSAGKQHWFKVPNLCKAVDTAACRKSVKTDTIVLKLRKVEVGTEWSDLTDEKDLYKQRREYRIEHGDLKGASTEQLLADMYQNATDEERSGLRDAMRVNREKRAEDAKKATSGQ